jgi:membrane-associated phospholipid phosphatase
MYWFYESLKAQKLFIFLLLLVFLSSGALLISFDKVTLFKKINENHFPDIDKVFLMMSYLGSGYTYILILGLMTFAGVKLRPLFGAGFSLVAITAIVQSMKIFLFKDMKRPCEVIEGFHSLNFSDCLHFKKLHSFPSGHAAVVFSIVIFLVFYFNSKWYYSIMAVTIACLVSYSRVFTGQHFFHDIYVGALIGTLTTFIVYIPFSNTTFLGSLFDNSFWKVLSLIRGKL